MMRETHAALVAHCGGSVSAVQAEIISQLLQTKRRLTALDRQFAETGAQVDPNGYVRLSNTYGRLLRQLGLKGAPAPQPSLQDLIRNWQPPSAPAAPPGQSQAAQTPPTASRAREPAATDGAVPEPVEADAA